jgi:hypothetical protein
VGIGALCLSLALSVLSVSLGATPPGQKIKGVTLPNNVLQVDWDELLPPNSAQHEAEVAPPPVHNYLGESAPAAKQTGSAAVNPDLEGLTLRIPGFIVPLEENSEGLVTEFLLVSYFGACIHVPPPPPNQIVYVKPARPVEVKDTFEAYWITGRMHVELRRDQIASSSYSMNASKIELYQ